MAGKFLLLEEVAGRLGISADDVHKLVDRKRLYPLRDGTTLKFKADDVERYAAELADGPADSGLELDLDLDADAPPAATGTVNVELLDDKATPAGKSDAAAVDAAAGRTVTGSGNAAEVSGLEIDMDENSGVSVFSDSPAANDAIAMTMLGTGDAIAGNFELDLDSVVGLSRAGGSAISGSASAASAGPATGAGKPGTFDLDLSDELAVGSGPNQQGSNPTGSLVASGGNAIDLSNGPRSGPGSALSNIVDSGLSLDDPDAAVSGIDLGPLDDGLSAEDGGTQLAGEAFDVDNGFDTDEESASVVAVEDSGDSSFFGTGADDSSQFSTDLSAATDDVSATDVTGLDVVRDSKFSLAQVIGLVCCSLLLLTGGFVMFDLMRTIGSPGDLTLSSPLLNPLAGVFGWR